MPPTASRRRSRRPTTSSPRSPTTSRSDWSPSAARSTSRCHPTLDRSRLDARIDGLELDESTAIGDALVDGHEPAAAEPQARRRPADAAHRRRRARRRAGPRRARAAHRRRDDVGRTTEEGGRPPPMPVPVFTIAFGTAGGHDQGPGQRRHRTRCPSSPSRSSESPRRPAGRRTRRRPARTGRRLRAIQDCSARPSARRSRSSPSDTWMWAAVAARHPRRRLGSRPVVAPRHGLTRSECFRLSECLQLRSPDRNTPMTANTRISVCVSTIPRPWRRAGGSASDCWRSPLPERRGGGLVICSPSRRTTRCGSTTRCTTRCRRAATREGIWFAGAFDDGQPGAEHGPPDRRSTSRRGASGLATTSSGSGSR